MWIKVKDELPELEQPVWMVVNERIIMGCRSNYAGDGWLWCRMYDLPYWIKGKGWDFEPHSDDDYQPTHWMPLPNLPKI